MSAAKTSAIPSAAWRDPACVVALGFGAGAAPVAPGTWGTLAAVPLYLLLQAWSMPYYLLWLAGAFVLGIWVCGRAARLLGVDDHSAIVWDEMVGYWLTMVGAPFGNVPQAGLGIAWILAGFVLFRLFDIWKPWPICSLDRHIGGGLGIMLDDVAAGGFAALCLYGGDKLIAKLING